MNYINFVIRAMMLRARPAVAESMPRTVDRSLLDWMEALLDLLPMSDLVVVDGGWKGGGKGEEVPVPELLAQLKGLVVC
jgi:hypothetical protein